MAISNFISTVWSESLLKALDKSYVGVANCNREFEGDIRGRGDRVKICGITSVNVFDYTKDTDFDDAPETLTDTAKTILIDNADAFNFQIDDIDRAQSAPNLMKAAMTTAADALATHADAYVYSLYSDAGATVTDAAASDTTILGDFISAVKVLLEHNVGNSRDIVFEVSPAVAELILKAKLLYNDLSTEVRSGCLGTLLGCPLYVSNNVVVEEDDDGETEHHMCLARTKRAVAFAEQLSEIDAYRPEKRFADAVKGLHLYGATVVYPEEMVCLDISLPVADAGDGEDEDDED